MNRTTAYILIIIDLAVYAALSIFCLFALELERSFPSGEIVPSLILFAVMILSFIGTFFSHKELRALERREDPHSKQIGILSAPIFILAVVLLYNS